MSLLIISSFSERLTSATWSLSQWVEFEKLINMFHEQIILWRSTDSLKRSDSKESLLLSKTPMKTPGECQNFKWNKVFQILVFSSLKSIVYLQKMPKGLFLWCFLQPFWSKRSRFHHCNYLKCLLLCSVKRPGLKYFGVNINCFLCELII